MIDIAPTIYCALGIDKILYTPKLEGYPLQEELPEEADSRTVLLKDHRQPKIKFEKSINETTITNKEYFEIKFNISDKNEVIGYLLLNNSLLNIYRNENIIKDERIKLICEYMIDGSNYTIGKYIISVMAFDEREKLKISSITIFIQEYKSIYEKLTDFISRSRYNRVMHIIARALAIINRIRSIDPRSNCCCGS